MLMLSRKNGQGLTLRHAVTGEVIRIVIDKAARGRSGVGIEAHTDWRILRDELEPKNATTDNDEKKAE